jgi:crossover junction endodeoxyribonuclease RuvC
LKILPPGNSSSETIPSSGVKNTHSGIARISRAENIKIIGIDPGVTATGFAIIQGQKGICTGTIRPKKADSYHKIDEICSALDEIIRQHRPGLAALERAFHHKNVASLVRISELRGAIIHTLIQTGTKIVEFMPTHVKLTATGNGRASKPQVRYFIERIFRLDVKPMSHHAIDALAIAYTAGRRILPRLERASD